MNTLTHITVDSWKFNPLQANAAFQTENIYLMCTVNHAGWNATLDLIGLQRRIQKPVKKCKICLFYKNS